MSAEQELRLGFGEEENKKATEHLERLLTYIHPEDLVIVGGLAIMHHFLSHGIEVSPRPFNDLDVMVSDVGKIDRSISHDFLVAHYHPKDHYLALVDRQSKTKVDVFDFNPAPNETITVIFNGKNIKMRSVEDQLVKTVLDIQRISEQLKVDPKQVSDAQKLTGIADMEKANRFWQSAEFEHSNLTIEEALKRAVDISKEHPDWLQEKPFHKPGSYECTSCASEDGFTITPMNEVYEVLGYVE